jgi:hypothetical protein
MENNKIKDRLMTIQKEEREPFLFPILKELFVKKGYENVEINHGKDEFGKDIVFKERDNRLKKDRWFAVVVKNKNAEMKDFEDGGEISRQINLSFQYPFKDSNGNENHISEVIVVINGNVGTQSKEIISKILKPQYQNNVDIWNYQKLGQEIDTEIKDLFLSGSGTNKDDIIVAKYKSEQIKVLSDLENAKNIYTGLDINDINDIFVNIHTTFNRYQEEKNRYQEEKTQIKEEIDDSISILNSNKNTLIKGIATSGKSLLMRRIGIKALEEERNNAVFYFKFRKLQNIQKINIDDLIREQYKSLTNEKIFNRDSYNKLVLLFDGLDELKSDEDKCSVMKNINDYIGNTSKNLQVIITGRNIEIFKGDLFENYEQVTLLPFDVGQALKLVKKIIPNDKGKANSFIAAIRNNQLSNSLTRTPMALTLAAILYKDGEVDLAELPANITELYNKFCDYYLNRWDTSKGISLQYKYEEVKHILAFIAQKLHNDGCQEISFEELNTFLSDLKQKHLIKELDDINFFFEGLKERPGIIQFDNENKHFSFSNLSFQEYFTSIYFDDSNERSLIDNFYNEWWENTIVFYCGKQPKRDVFINKAITTIIPIELKQYFQHISLLSKCIQASHLMPIASQSKIIKNIIFNFDRLYKKALEIDIINNKDKDKKERTGLTTILSTLDVILQFRNMFEKLFQTKHIDSNSFSSIALEIIIDKNCDFSDVTLYSLSYFLSHKLNDPIFLSEFIKKPSLNVRWNRIVLVDIEFLRLKQKIDSDTYKRIKRKYEHNKKYINQQFREDAFSHIVDNN